MFVFARIKLYAIAAGAFLLALVGIYFRGRSDAADRLEAKRAKAQFDAMKQAKEIADEIENLDDPGLSERASRYVRGNNN